MHETPRLSAKFSSYDPFKTARLNHAGGKNKLCHSCGATATLATKGFPRASKHLLDPSRASKGLQSKGLQAPPRLSRSLHKPPAALRGLQGPPGLQNHKALYSLLRDQEVECSLKPSPEVANSGGPVPARSVPVPVPVARSPGPVPLARPGGCPVARSRWPGPGGPVPVARSRSRFKGACSRPREKRPILQRFPDVGCFVELPCPTLNP